MTIYISMLRGINVSGQKRIRMEELSQIYQALNFADVETYLQSGNVVFEDMEADTDKLAASIEADIEKFLGFSLKVFVRSIGEFARIVAGNPFTAAQHLEPAKLHVTFLCKPLPREALEGMNNPNDDGDEFFLAGNKIYLYCPNGYGRTKLNNNFFEKRSGLPATTRNWNTVKALYEMAKRHDIKRNSLAA